MGLENQTGGRSHRAGYRIPVQITESGHVDLARVRWFTSSEVGAAISLKSIWRGWDRCRLWLWPQAALSITIWAAKEPRAHSGRGPNHRRASNGNPAANGQ